MEFVKDVPKHDPAGDHAAHLLEYYSQVLGPQISASTEPERKAVIASHSQAGDVVSGRERLQGIAPTLRCDQFVQPDVDLTQAYVHRQEEIETLPQPVTIPVTPMVTAAKGYDVSTMSKLMGGKTAQAATWVGAVQRASNGLVQAEDMELQGIMLAVCILADALRHGCIPHGPDAAGKIQIASVLASETGNDRSVDLADFASAPVVEPGRGMSDDGLRVLLHCLGPALDLAHKDNPAWTRPATNYRIAGGTTHVVVIRRVGEPVPITVHDARLIRPSHCEDLLRWFTERVGDSLVRGAMNDAAMLNLVYRPSISPAVYTAAQNAGELVDVGVAPLPPGMPAKPPTFPDNPPEAYYPAVAFPDRSGPPRADARRMKGLTDVLKGMGAAAQAAQAAADNVPVVAKHYCAVRYCEDGLLRIDADPTGQVAGLYNAANTVLAGCFINAVIWPSAVPPDFLPASCDALWQEYAFCAMHRAGGLRPNQLGIDGVYFAAGPLGGAMRVAQVVDPGRPAPPRVPRISTAAAPVRDGVRDVFGRVFGGRVRAPVIDAAAACALFSGIVSAPQRHPPYPLGNQRHASKLFMDCARDRHLHFAASAQARGAVIGNPADHAKLVSAATDFPGLNSIVPEDVGLAEYPFGSYEVFEATYRRGNLNGQAYVGLRHSAGLKYDQKDAASEKVEGVQMHIAADELARETGRGVMGPTVLAVNRAPPAPIHRIMLSVPFNAYPGARAPGIVATGSVPSFLPDRFGTFTYEPRLFTPGVPNGVAFQRPEATGGLAPISAAVV